MTNRWLSLLLGLIATSICFAASAQEAKLSVEYDIAISLDTEAHTLVGTQTVALTNTGENAVSEIPFALIANWGAEANPYLPPAGFGETSGRNPGVFDS